MWIGVLERIGMIEEARNYFEREPSLGFQMTLTFIFWPQIIS